MGKEGSFVFVKKIDSNTNAEIEEINLSNYKIDRPLVLILNGSGLENNTQAGKSINVINSLLGDFVLKADVISVNYNKVTYNEDLLDSNISRLVDELFFPLTTSDGKRIDTESACKNMRNINIFAHCYGNTVIRLLLERLDEKMETIGYNRTERELIIEQIFAVIFASNYTTSQIKHLNVISPNDKMFVSVGDKLWESMAVKLISGQNDIKISLTDKEKIIDILNKAKVNGSKQCYVSSKLFKDFYEKNDRCYVMQDNRGLDLVTSPIYTNGRPDHTMSGLARGENGESNVDLTPSGECVSKCISYSLSSSVANSILNNESDIFIPFSIGKLKSKLENIVQPLNEQKLDNNQNLST